MKLYLLFILFISSQLIAQRKISVEKIDSVKIYLEIASFNSRTNDYSKSLYYTQKAIDFANTKKNNEAIAKSYLALGHIYFELKKYDDAIEIFKKSSHFYSKLPPSGKKAYCNYQLGLCYMQKNNYSIAEKYFNNATKIYSLIKIPDAIELINLQKGIIFKAKGQNNLAIHLFEQIISKSDEADVFKTKAEALFQLSDIEMQKKRYGLALNYLNRAYKLNLKDNNLEQKSKIVLALNKVNDKLLNTEIAYNYLKKHIELEDSISGLNANKIVPEDYEQFKENEKIKTIEQLDKENKEQIKSNKVSKLISILAFALIFILSLLSLTLYKNNVIRNKSNLLLKENNQKLVEATIKAENAAKARSEFLSTVSHELRTPLNAINGITHLLLEENPLPSQMNYLTSLKFSGNYLLTFINEILEINRIESTIIETESIDFNIKELIDNLQSSLKELALINNNTFSIKIDKNIPHNLMGDPTKLSQIFMNLINNALKFTTNGSVNVILKLNQINREYVDIHFDFIDNGIGISVEKLETIFDSFSQGSIEINRKYGGTGLGLSIVKKLIKILGGEIVVKSDVAKGTTFSFDLNFKIGTNHINVGKLKTQFDENIFKNKKVLLIEDNKINQMITKKMLENKGMHCEVIDNGEDSIEAVKNKKYDLVLMDIHLPGINGTVATETIRTFDKETIIIALTAISLNENRAMLLSYGMNDVITKPFDPNEFYKTLADNMTKKS